MKKIFLIILSIAVLAIVASTAKAQFPTPTPPIPISVSSVKIKKMRVFPAEVEIETSLGRFTGTGSLEHGATVCTSLAPCLSGTVMNTQFRISNVRGTLNGTEFAMSQGFWIDYSSIWTVPYFHPFGRPIMKRQDAIVHPTSIVINPVSNPAVNYSAPLNMTGSIRTEMAPLSRFQAPRPFTQFVSVDIQLVQSPTG